MMKSDDSIQQISNPLLSIVIPIFNRPEKTSVMFDSILANDFQDWELLAIDDGSDETTRLLLQSYQEKDGRIRVIYRERLPKGAQSCRNIGIELSTGEFVVFFDSDDFVAPYCLRQRVDSIQHYPSLDFCVFRSGIYADNHFDVRPQPFIYGFPIYKNDIRAFCRRSLPFIVWNNIYRRESLIRNGLSWDVNLLSLQDADFNLQALLKGLQYQYVETEPDYGYRIDANPNSVSKCIVSDAHFNSHLYAIRKFFSSVQAKYGHCYDYSLYVGVLYIFNMLFSDGIIFHQAEQIVKCVKCYSSFWGNVLSFQVKCSSLLAHFVPAKQARQIPMLSYLLRQYYKKHNWLSRI